MARTARWQRVGGAPRATPGERASAPLHSLCGASHPSRCRRLSGCLSVWPHATAAMQRDASPPSRAISILVSLAESLRPSSTHSPLGMPSNRAQSSTKPKKKASKQLLKMYTLSLCLQLMICTRYTQQLHQGEVGPSAAPLQRAALSLRVCRHRHPAVCPPCATRVTRQPAATTVHTTCLGPSARTTTQW